MSNFVKSQSLVLVESAVCGATHEGINRFYYGIPISYQQGLLSAGSHYISGSVSSNFAQPVVSGAIYSLGDMALQIDNRSFLSKLLQQAGSM